MNVMLTDSYKAGHHRMYEKGTEYVFSYLEAREGGQYPETTFFGLQPILRTLTGPVVTAPRIRVANNILEAHFGTTEEFNKAGWEYIATKHNGRLPLRIKAVPEGTSVPLGNALMTVENTDPNCAFLTNAVESLLLHVWYPSNVATISRNVKVYLKDALERSADSLDALPFMLHDFGYRGAATHDAAAIGGAGHLINFLGTDTLPAMELALDEYDANLNDLAFSVPASEHSVMTARGRQREYEVVADLIEQHPTGILSVVADSYDIWAFVDTLGTLFKNRILARDGKFVVRPDSCPDGFTPAQVVLNIADRLKKTFGYTINSKGLCVLNPHVGIIWGDGIDPDGVKAIVEVLIAAGYSAENIVFGMGGALLQKHDRDTQRNAFKASAICVNGQWHDAYKAPLGGAKPSKAGRLKLIKGIGGYGTVTEDQLVFQKYPNELKIVFENGQLVNEQTFDQIRERAAL